MQLNIKNRRAFELAHSLSRLTGESVTEAVTKALEQRLEAEAARKKRGSTLEIEDRERAIRHIRKQGRKFREKGLSSDHDWLYDEDGLPS